MYRGSLYKTYKTLLRGIYIKKLAHRASPSVQDFEAKSFYYRAFTYCIYL